MSKVVLLTAALVMAATAAIAEGYARDRDDDRAGWRDDRGTISRDRDDPSSMRDDERGHRAGSASFFLRSGDTRLSVRCDERESMRSCVDAALLLFDRVRPQQAAP